jgi:hypothetical protein
MNPDDFLLHAIPAALRAVAGPAAARAAPPPAPPTPRLLLRTEVA